MKRVERRKERGVRLISQRNKRAAMEMSFQFIFSIILVAVVLFVGFFVINMFLKQAEKNKLLLSVSDIRSKVDEVSASYGASELMDFKLNPAVKMICFADASICSRSRSTNPKERPPDDFCSSISAYQGTSMNMFFYPASSVWKYNVADAHEIYCGSESQKKNCLNVSVARCFAPDFEGAISFRVEKPNEEVKTFVRAP